MPMKRSGGSKKLQEEPSVATKEVGGETGGCSKSGAITSLVDHVEDLDIFLGFGLTGWLRAVVEVAHSKSTWPRG